MKYKNKHEVMRDFKNGKLSKWEVDVILENLEFEKNLSDVGKIILDLNGVK